MVIDKEALENVLKDLVAKYRAERERTKSAARAIAKAKQEAIVEVLDLVAGMEAAADKPAISAANPWRYFADIDDDCVIMRVKRGGEGTLYHKDGAVMPAPQNIEWYENDAKKPMPFCREVAEAEAVAILGGKRPWEPEKPDNQAELVTTKVKNVRYFYDQKFSVAITRFDGEDGMIYGDDGSSDNTNLPIVWHEQNETEITEEKAVEILGGKRPWGTEKQSPATSTAVALLRESKQFCGTKTAEMIDQAIAMLVGGGEC